MAVIKDLKVPLKTRQFTIFVLASKTKFELELELIQTQMEQIKMLQTEEVRCEKEV